MEIRGLQDSSRGEKSPSLLSFLGSELISLSSFLRFNSARRRVQPTLSRRSHHRSRLGRSSKRLGRSGGRLPSRPSTSVGQEPSSSDLRHQARQERQGRHPSISSTSSEPYSHPSRAHCYREERKARNCRLQDRSVASRLPSFPSAVG